MKKSLSLFALVAGLCGILAASIASAEEGISDIALNQEMKSLAIRNLQSLMAKQQNMTQEEIVIDLETLAMDNSARLAKRGISAELRLPLAQLKSLDKDTILALEAQHIQSLLSSGNYVFLLTRVDATVLGQETSNMGFNAQALGDILLFPITVALDIAVLPITFIASLVTGF